MPGKRDATRDKITWSLEMNNKLLLCKAEATRLTKGENPPLKANGRKKGYMEVMRELFLVHFPGLEILTSQNLRDKVASLEKNTASSVCNLRELVTVETNIVNTVESINNESMENMFGMCNQAPLTEFESKTLTDARELLNELIVNKNDMCKRKWSTRTRKTPPIEEVKSIDRICHALIVETDLRTMDDGLHALWMLNCIIYVAVVSWLLNTNVKCEIRSRGQSVGNKKFVPNWLREFDEKLKSLRSFISKCYAEIDRLSSNRRLTRKSRRNREMIKSQIKKDEEISIYSVTKCTERSKAKLKRLARKRKRKIASEKAILWNTKFKEKQSNVYNTFKDIISSDDQNEYPVFKEISKSRKFFTSQVEVEGFWKSLWTKTDEGKPEIAWLGEIEEIFKSIIPETSEENVLISSKDFLKSIKKKRNWSSPGPDLVVNFWLKKLTSTHEISHEIFNELINKDFITPVWFSCGRTGLLEKPGTWEVTNTRPITCTNNQYKLFTSLLNTELSKHNGKYQLMQMDQRGAKEKCSGTHQNLLIDDMVLKDVQDNKRNLAAAWVDIRKAYDSLSHSWLIRCLKIHRVPVKLVKAISSVISSWSVRLVIPLEKGDVLTEPIPISNGLLQGDSICANLFTLALNPVAWEIRRSNGYILSKPISTKITHLIYIDDLKIYAKNMIELITLLSKVKEKMGHAGLHWNSKKCNFLLITRGKRDNSIGEITLGDDSKVKAVEDEKAYKFLGIPEAEEHQIRDVLTHLKLQVKQRASVIWSSPLSDYNKVMASNIFVLSPALYFMWTEKMRLEDLRDLDRLLREAMNASCAKYKLQMNASVYLDRSKGGRGLKSFEMTYKEIKVKAAIRLITEIDDRLVTVKEFDLNRKNKNRSSIIKDGIDYALNDFNMSLTFSDSSFEVKYKQNDIEKITSEKVTIAKALREATTSKWENEILNSNWQGNIFKIRKKDEHLIKNKCYNWLTNWKECPVNIINDLHSIHLQTVPTLTFTTYRSASLNTSKICRLCHKGEESVKHLLSNCGKLVKVDFIRRHNKALQYILFPLLLSNEFIESSPPWYTPMVIKPRYENEKVLILWDIPEYSGTEEDENEDKLFRPDGKVIFKHDRKVLLLEMSVPWIENRELKLEEKIVKYEGIIRNLKLEYPGFKVDQATFIIDSLGGYSQHLKKNLAKLGYKGDTIEKLLTKLQKIVLSEARYIINKFKISTSR